MSRGRYIFVLALEVWGTVLRMPRGSGDMRMGATLTADKDARWMGLHAGGLHCGARGRVRWRWGTVARDA